MTLAKMQPPLLPPVNHSTEDRDENRNDYSPLKSKQTRISIHQGKRFLPYATIIGAFCLLFNQ